MADRFKGLERAERVVCECGHAQEDHCDGSDDCERDCFGDNYACRCHKFEQARAKRAGKGSGR